MRHFIYGDFPGLWSNSYGPDTALWFELHHELGERVGIYLEEEAFGFGALFDLQYEQYMRDTD